MKKGSTFHIRAIALTLVFTILFQVMQPTLSFALTSGPAQPESAQFQPVGTSDMVDLFTGDFGYNIPLMELPGPNGGYPFNLSYQGGITMDQEASWVGLGWNVNPGAIVRNMRGLPDEFNGDNDAIISEMDMKKNETYGVSVNIGAEFAGGDPSIGDPPPAPGAPTPDPGSSMGNFGMSISINIYNNTYKGIGYGLDLGTSFSQNNESGMNAGVGMNISLDSQDGVGSSSSLTVSQAANKKKTESNGDAIARKSQLGMGLGIGFHSTGGLNGSISGSVTRTSKEVQLENGGSKQTTSRQSGSSYISFSAPSHTPTIGMQMKSQSLNIHLSVGGGTNAVYVNGGINGFYSLSKVANKSEKLPAYGYMHLQDKNEESALSDFNREKDGILYRKSKNLASPSLTYDFYIINGQGTGGMFRPYRQDYGHIHEQGRTSTGAGGTLGFDVGIPGHYGINGSFNYSRSHTGDWDADHDNAANNLFQFRGKGYRNSNADNYKGNQYEGVYFKLAGENAAIPANELDNILGTKAVELQNNKHKLSQKLTASNGNYHTLVKKDMRREARTPRAVSIIPYTNEQIMTKDANKNVGNEILREYDIDVYRHINALATIGKDNIGNLTSYSGVSKARGKDGNNKMANGNHLAGHTVLQPDGKRYVYALPAYNNTQQDETFSVKVPTQPNTTISYDLNGNNPKYIHSSSPDAVNGDLNVTDEYHEKTTIPRYPHSYLLTSVLGDDYVDADTIAGPSVGDYGYWVKFNYVQTSENFQWRSPFSGANYHPGSAGSSVDDKASYSYGTKEIWYLASAETQTHIMYFEMSFREDGLGASGAASANTVPGTPDGVNRLYKLDRIKLYSKADKSTEPLQTVHFEYDYALCKGIPNSNAAKKAKLTLKKIYFTHKYDRSGALSPYIFEYDEIDNNPYYDIAHSKYDRWGTYRSLDYGNDRVNQEFPYTPQLNYTEIQDKVHRDAFKAQTDKNASAWSLIGVQLPSGGKIKIEYESDDYAYVQHKKATQMFNMASVGISPTSSGVKNKLFDKHDGLWGLGFGNAEAVSRNARMVHFKLEKPIPTGNIPLAKAQLINDYFDCLFDKKAKTYTQPIYAKFKANLRGSISDYISGYFYAELDDDGKPYCGLSGPITVDGVDCYEYGFLVLDFAKVDGHKVRQPPLAVAAWQYMRTNLPRVLTGMGDFESSENGTDMEKMTRAASLASWVNTIRTMFSGYRHYCYDKEFANTIVLAESFIRLSTPDGIKYGGGSRVKKIYVQDDPVWGTDKIGQVYDYTKKDDVRGTISSGVASYEPVIGGEENALRTAKIYAQDIPFFTDNNLFTELPINESYYPAPRVGYSQVTVTSLATAEVQEKITQNADPATYQGILTTGRTVHEFYTARDFPVIAEETDLQPYGEPAIIPLPFIGMIQISKLTASQGYSIQLNDMHGKPKSVATYASKKIGGFLPDPITKVEYIYKSEPFIYEGEEVNKLINLVEVLKDDPQMRGADHSIASSYHQAITEKMYVGMEYDFFADFRHAVDEAGTGGLSFNMDIMGGGVVQFPLPFPWPSFNFSHTSTRMAVTNKIINSSGILQKIVATDGQSIVSTENLVWDKYTGQPLVTTVNNNYDNQIYNYEYPAYMAYEGTGAAYENILMEFTGSLSFLKGKGWILNKGDILATPAPIYTIGNSPGMGDNLETIANVGNYIKYEDLYDYLQEGDEFIVEFLKYDQDAPKEKYKVNGDKKLATLIEKRTGATYIGCEDDKQLIFNWNVTDPFTWKLGVAVRMLLVRSGKRNLLNLKTGAIKTLLQPGSTGSLVENSPLYKREKVYTAGTAQPFLYDSLTSQLSQFLNGILDCNGQFPVGSYFMDHPRFLKNDGNLKYPQLFGLLKSINVFDNCGGFQDCSRTHDSTYEVLENKYFVTCKQSCMPPKADIYDNPQCTAALPNSSQINTYVNSMVMAGHTSSSEIVNGWNAYSLSHGFPCTQMGHTAPGIYTTEICDVSSCLGCNVNIGKTGNVFEYRGYHLVLQFREEFQAATGSCITTHCLAKSKYLEGGVIKRTRINQVQAISPGSIRFIYQPGQNQEPINQSNYCMKEYNFTLPATFYKIKNVLAASAVELTPYKLNEDMYKVKTCTVVNGIVVTNTGPIDLYSPGYKGIWRPSKTYYYADERFQGNKPTSSANMTSMLNLATDGTFDGTQNASTGVYDTSFFLFNWNSFPAKKIYPKWMPNETVTKYTRNSQSAEARDVLGLYSSVLFDKKGYLPVAVGRNMRANEMVYENFDNTNTIGWTATDDLESNGALDINQVQVIGSPFTGNKCLSTKTPTRYIFNRSQFAPVPGKDYIISMWAGGYNTLFSPEEIDARFSHLMEIWVYFIDKNGALVIPPNAAPYQGLRLKTSGKIYEGKGSFWRKLEGKIKIPANTDRLMISFGTTGFSSDAAHQEYGTMYRMLNPDGKVFIDQRALYDDIRIFPADGLMQTYVYDENNYRLVAEGDENNFPTLYGYSPSGALMLVKKLTEEGIKTLKEIRSNTKRQ